MRQLSEINKDEMKEASDYMVSVKRNQLRVRFNVMYGKKK